MMISPTGDTKNNQYSRPFWQTGRICFSPKRAGFTLLEVLVSISILAIFLVSIYQGFSIILDALIKTDNYNQSVLLAEEKLYSLSEALKQDKELKGFDLSGELQKGIKVFKWETLMSEPDSYPDLRQVEITVNWRQGIRQGRVNLATYLETKPEK